MSGVLKRIKGKKKIAAFGFALLVMAAVAAFGICFHLHPAYYVVVYLLIILIVMLSYAVRNKMRAMSAPFGTFSSTRNVDYLVIGDFCKVKDYVPQGASYVQIAAPGRGLNSSFQILKHTHSILKEEGGSVIIAVGKGKKDFSVFDIPFLHPITIKKYHLERLRKMSKLTFIFSPIDSIRFLLGGGYSAYTPVQNVDAELAAFCEERGYSLVCLKKQ